MISQIAASILLVCLVASGCDAKSVCTTEYAPVCCFDPKMRYPYYSAPNICVCVTGGGHPLPGPACPVRRELAGASLGRAAAAAHPAAPVGAPIRQVACTAEYNPVCCYYPFGSPNGKRYEDQPNDCFCATSGGYPTGSPHCPRM